jgi:nicotinate-nucleotide adenylyltransferase
MVHSLESLRQEQGDQTGITLVMGTDALMGLNRWHRWTELLALANILVIQRPGWDLSPEPWLEELLAQHQCDEVQTLQQERCGKICLVALNPLDISATEIRRQLALGQSPQFIMPDKVLDFIVRHKLYGVKN